jgi:adenosylcobinamide kinase/adenosylcobinamide-phosphate guanylyltransferase
LDKGQIILVTGAARSGKSEWAEELARRSQRAVVYVATATVERDDAEWQARIEQHRQRRPPEWQVLVAPQNLAAAVRSATADHCLLIDSVGTWLANHTEQDDTAWAETVQELLASLRQTSAAIILVAEETGWGVVPAYPLGRLFRDRLGNLTRQIASLADVTYLVAAGYVLNLSQVGTRLDASLGT